MNEVEKKEIEKMAYAIRMSGCIPVYDIHIEEKDIAEELYNAGYRNCKALLEENERLVQANNIMFDALQEVQKMAKEMISGENVKKIETEVKEMQKQAIKEFAEKFWDKYHGDMKMGDVRLLLDRLLKEYGIGEE